MPNIRLTIAYDGGCYSGWQRTQNAKKPCIQAVIEDTLSELHQEEISLIGSGRTDAGVHALGQTANYHCRVGMPVEELRMKLNLRLPEDIRIRKAQIVPKNFHSRYDAVSKIYEYRIDIRNPSNVFARKYAHQEPAGLDLESMSRAAKALVGTHDFAAFCTPRKGEASTVRTIYELSLRKENDQIILSAKGDGFLYHMVRIITGTLIEVGRGIREPETIPELLAGSTRSQAGWLAPANGLYLKEVQYKNG